MRWSWKIGEFFGIGVYVHATFLLLLGFVAYSYWQQSQSWPVVIEGVAFLLTLFLCVVLHEYGHALTARRYGIRTRDITLLPIGGVARLERMPDEPRQELIVAIAGPAVNVVIALLIGTYLVLTRGWTPLSEMGVVTGPFLERLLVVNLFLVGFNLIPAFPMDGGRMLRAVLAMRLGPVRATHIAAALGQGLALVFGFVGLLVNPFLIFIALFVWIGAAQESNLVEVRSALHGLPVRQLMMTEFHRLDVREPLDRAVQLTLAGSQKEFPVFDSGHLVGILTQARLFEKLREPEGLQQTVESAMQPAAEGVDPGTPAETALARLEQASGQTLPVLRDGQLVGLFTIENLGEFLRIRSALHKA